METKFNFKSQICTTREQSERLLKLGLKKNTADMCYSFDSVITQPFIPSDIFRCVVDTDTENKKTIPAWSLHRLIEILDTNPFVFYTNCGYDNVIDRIEEYIKEGFIDARYMNEGYLEEE